MKTSDEISSTEKLLDLIQKGKNSDNVTPHLSSQAKNKKKFSIEGLFKKNEKIGVCLGYRDIRLVKIHAEPKDSWRIIECRSEPLDFSNNINTKDVNHLFRNILKEFCGDPKKSEIWCIMPTSKMEIRNIKIPKVPRGQVYNAVKWTLKKEIKFDEKDSIIDFEIGDDVSDNGILKTSVMSFIVPRPEVEELKKEFYNAGFPLTGISIGPFAIQNLFRTGFLTAEKEYSGNIYIGEDWSSIDVFASGNLKLSRTIKTGIKGMVDSLSDYLMKKHDENSSFSEQTVETLSKNILLNFCRKAEEPDRNFDEFDITETEILESINPHFDRLIKQTERSFEHHALSMKDGEMGKIFLGGEIYAYKNMDKHIRELIGIQTEMIDLPDLSVNPSKQEQIPKNIIDRACYVPAFGIALSDNSWTPNFLYTYEDKEKDEKVNRIGRWSALSFALLSLLSIAFFFYQGWLIEKKEADIKSSHYELQKYGPQMDLNTINQFVTRAMGNQEDLKAYAGRYLPMAVISELSNLTPQEIRLNDLHAIFSNGVNSDKKKASEKYLTIEGSVSGKNADPESRLAEYILSLENSPIFLNPVIIETTREVLDGKEDLLFTLKLTIDTD